MSDKHTPNDQTAAPDASQIAPTDSASGLPTPTENPDGLHTPYIISKANGEPVDPAAEYFVLRLDSKGSDPKHMAACRKAVLVYADAIKDHIPGLSRHLWERYGQGEKAKEGVTWSPGEPPKDGRYYIGVGRIVSSSAHGGGSWPFLSYARYFIQGNHHMWVDKNDLVIASEPEDRIYFDFWSKEPTNE